MLSRDQIKANAIAKIRAADGLPIELLIDCVLCRGGNYSSASEQTLREVLAELRREGTVFSDGTFYRLAPTRSYETTEHQAEREAAAFLPPKRSGIRRIFRGRSA